MNHSVPCGVGKWSHPGDGVQIQRSGVVWVLSCHLECPSGSLKWASMSDRSLSGILKGAASQSPTTPLTPCRSTNQGPCLVWLHTCQEKPSRRPLFSFSASFLSHKGLVSALTNPHKGTFYIFPCICLLEPFRKPRLGFTLNPCSCRVIYVFTLYSKWRQISMNVLDCDCTLEPPREP